LEIFRVNVSNMVYKYKFSCFHHNFSQTLAWF
jgi:hypothetical protein